MDNLILIVSIYMGKSIRIQRVKSFSIHLMFKYQSKLLMDSINRLFCIKMVPCLAYFQISFQSVIMGPKSSKHKLLPSIAQSESADTELVKEFCQ